MVRKLFNKIPLAWLQVTREKTRLAVAIAEIAFADLLIFIQMGFEGALYDSAVKPHRTLQADLVLINPQLQTLVAVKGFPRERLYQSLSYEGVASVSPLYIDSGLWRNPETRITRAILVWGIEPTKPVFKLSEVNQNLDQLKLLNQVLFDQAGRPEYGKVADIFNQTGTVETELNNKIISVKGLFTNGSSFAADGNIITSDSTFLQLFPDRKPGQIEVGLINLMPGAEIKQVRS